MQTRKTRKTTAQEQEIMEWLNGLRESGITNMFGAPPYVELRFGVDQREARRVVTLWMKNFNDEADYREVKAD